MNRNGQFTSLCLWGAVLLQFAGPPVGAEEGLQKYEFQQIRMGVPVKIVLYAPGEEVANKAAEAAFARFKELDRILSDYDPDSEVSQLCRQPAGTTVKVSQDLATILDWSLRYSRESEGAFDVSVGPLIKLWRISRRRKELPGPAQLAEAKHRCGYQSVQLNTKEQTVTLLKEDMQLDFGGIAQGYAADEALKILKTHGLSRVLIDASGDLVLGDPPPGKDFWKIEVEPLKQGQDNAPPTYLALKNCSVTTSGDAYQFVEIAGQRYSHIVDPSTGLGLTRRSSVTVLAPTGIEADALATMISILGPEAGLKLLADKPGYELHAVTMDQTSSTPSIKDSVGFGKLLLPEHD